MDVDSCPWRTRPANRNYLLDFKGGEKGSHREVRAVPGKLYSKKDTRATFLRLLVRVNSELVMSDAEAYAAKCKNYALSITSEILAPICKRRISLSVFDRNRYRVSLFIDAITTMIAIT